MGDMMNTDKSIKEFIEFYGEDKIPDPEQYPLRFKFLFESFKHYNKMKETNENRLEN